jgi:hypothetical protein
MKSILVLMGLMLSLVSIADSSPQVVDIQEFDKMMSIESSDDKAMYPWMYSATTCYAQTRCANGRIARCQTYGYAYSNIPAQMRNTCSYFVLPGRGVRCTGYAQVRDFYGRSIWTYVDVPVSCF